MKKRQWLIDLREKKDLTQEQMAVLCETTQMNISHIENGVRRPSPELAQRIAKILKFKWTKFYENEEKE